MADHVLFIGWNQPHVGREKDALEVFNSSLAYYSKLAASGQIESFEPVLLEPHGGDLNGFFLLRGSAEKLHAVTQADEFRDIIVKAGLTVAGIGVIPGMINEGLMREMGRWQKSLG